MKNKKVKYLAMLLAFSMAVSPMSYTKAYAENAETAQAAGAVNAGENLTDGAGIQEQILPVEQIPLVEPIHPMEQIPLVEPIHPMGRSPLMQIIPETNQKKMVLRMQVQKIQVHRIRIHRHRIPAVPVKIREKIRILLMRREKEKILKK